MLQRWWHALAFGSAHTEVRLTTTEEDHPVPNLMHPTTALRDTAYTRCMCKRCSRKIPGSLPSSQTLTYTMVPAYREARTVQRSASYPRQS
jgi:hypothetical protein